MSSESLDIMDTSAEGPLVEVTLQSLSGLRYNLPSATTTTRVPCVTAAVGFAGSATDMQVSSSFLCGNTGNVVVESQAAALPPDFEDDDQSTCPLLVEWRESERSLSRSFSSSSGSEAPKQPHLTIRLPERDQKLPSVPLSKMNRDCNVVHDKDDDPPSLDESETSSQNSRHQRREQKQLDLVETTSEVRGASVVWSNSGAGMPDIIELHVLLIMDNEDSQNDDYQSQQQTTHQVGIAYLVFFGSDIGTTVLDLPIKKQTMSASHNLSGVSLNDHAFLRVCVTVVPFGEQKIKTPSPIKESFLQDMQKLEPILQQLHVAHEDPQLEITPELQEEKSGGSRFLCGSGDVSFMDIFKTLSGVVKNCDDGEGVLRQTDSMGSTIVTSASLGI